MDRLTLASSNLYKQKEISELVKDRIEILIPTKKIDVEEIGTSFYENSLIKASKYWNQLKTPILSDDSGLEVDYLPDELGVYSADFGGENLSDRERCELLLEKLKGVNKSNRKASFICMLCLYLNPKEIFFFQGKLKGEISLDYRGDEGFGYDPVFIPSEIDYKTLAQLPNFKAKNSHRAEACKSLVKFVCQQTKA